MNAEPAGSDEECGSPAPERHGDANAKHHDTGVTMKANAGRIRELREEKGWSQEHLAAVAGLSPRTIQRIEREGSGAKESRMALAAAFEIDVADLVQRPGGTGAAAGAAPAPASQRVNQVLWAISLTMLAVAMSYGFGKDLGTMLSHTCEIPAAERV